MAIRGIASTLTEMLHHRQDPDSCFYVQLEPAELGLPSCVDPAQDHAVGMLYHTLPSTDEDHEVHPFPMQVKAASLGHKSFLEPQEGLCL